VPKLWPVAGLKKLTWFDFSSASVLSTTGAIAAVNNTYIINWLKFQNSQTPTTIQTIPGLLEYSSMWNKFKVIGVKATIKFINQSQENMYVGMGFSTTALAGYPTPSWANVTAYGTGNPKWKMTMIRWAPQGAITMSSYCDLGKLTGSKRQYIGEEDWQGTTGGATQANRIDPVNALYLHVFLANATSTAVACSMNTEVKLDYYIRFTERPLEGN